MSWARRPRSAVWSDATGKDIRITVRIMTEQEDD